MRVGIAMRGLLSVVGVVVMTWFEHRVAHVTGDRLPGAVEAALPDSVPQLADAGAVRVVGDGGGLGDRVGVDGEHAKLA